MQTLYIGIQPTPLNTRMVAQDASGQTLLRARLARDLTRSGALPRFLIALAHSYQARVHAVLFAEPTVLGSVPACGPRARQSAASGPVRLVLRPPLPAPPRGSAHRGFRALSDQLFVEALLS